jgi:hypothetical protein
VTGDRTQRVQPRARTSTASAIGLIGTLAIVTLAVAVIAMLAAGVLSPARPQLLLDPGWPDYGLRHAPPAFDDD